MRLTRSIRRNLGFKLASLMCLALTVWTGMPAHAAESTALSADSSHLSAHLGQGSTDEGLAVMIDTISPKILTTEGELLVAGEVKNTSGQMLTNPAILLSMSSLTPISVTELAKEFSDSSAPGPMVAAANLGTDLHEGETQRFEIRVPVEDLPLGPSSAWGPRTIAVTALSGDCAGSDRSIVVRDSGEELSQTRLGVLVPWTSQNSTGTVEEQRAVLSIAALQGATLAMDSTVLPSPLSENSEDGAARVNAKNRANGAFVSTLLTSTPQIVALPEGDADLGALTLEGNSALTERALDSITKVPSSPTAAGWGASTSSSPSSSPSSPQSASQSSSAGGASPLADSSQSGSRIAPDTLTVIRNVVWPSEASFGTQELAAFPERVSIAPAGALQPSEEISFTSLAVAEVDTATGLISPTGKTHTTASVLIQDSTIVDLLNWATSNNAEELDAEQALIAVTAIITRERPNASRTVFAATSRANAPTARLADRLSTLLHLRWIAPSSFFDLATSEPTDVERTQVDHAVLDDATKHALSTLSTSLENLTPLAQATSAPEEVFSSVSDGLLSATSAAVDPHERLSRASQFSARVSGLRMQVQAEPSTAVNLINKSADFPIRVRNELDWNVDVTVTLTPSDPRLRVKKPTTTTLEAGSVTSVEVPVSAIGSGDIEVIYRVATPDGSLLSESHPVLVRLRAGWEDAFTVAAAIGLGLLFIGGLVRRLRSRAHLTHDDTPDGE